MSKLRALIVEDSESDAKLVLREIQRRGLEVEARRVEDAASLREALATESWNVILCDWSLPNFNARSALEILKQSGLDVPFIIVSGTVGEEMAVEAVRAGAHDYLLKDRLTRLVPSIQREMREAKARAERQQLEGQLLQAQKMDALGRLATGIAHDFNNILTVIQSETTLLRDALSRQADVTQHIDGISSAAERAASLTRQLLTVSRRQPRNPRRVSLNSIVGDVQKMLRRILGEGVRMSTVTLASPAVIEADPEQIGQVLLNLAVNARDAMPGGGELSIQTADVMLDDAAAATMDLGGGAYVELTVGDTGCGIPPDTLSHIFEPFFTTKEVGKGTGLGLSTVFTILRQSNGGVQVRSEPGSGTTFKLYFPSVDGAVAAPTPRPEVSAEVDDDHRTILVVDDDPHVRKSVCRLLSLQGFAVLSAPEPKIAIEIFGQYREVIDIVLTDLMMPGMSGRALARRLQQIQPDVRVLFMSGFAEYNVPGADALEREERVVQKPFTGTEIARAIRQSLRPSA
jgi:signal transduction histidine kinase